MVVYTVTWLVDKNLIKGLGIASTKVSEIHFSVLCRNSRDAISCLYYVFVQTFGANTKLHVDDGKISLSRSAVDSRGFNPTYLMCDGIREPIVLSDLKSNALRIHKIFGI